MNKKPLHIGCGAGFSGDRVDAGIHVARTLIDSGLPSVLIFETLAERTLALAQTIKRNKPDKGYDPHLEAYLSDVLPLCLKHGIKIIGNFGAANPRAAADKVLRLAESLKIGPLKVGVVEGDDLFESLSPVAILEIDTDPPITTNSDEIISANAYLGAQPIAQALSSGADVVITGRVADASLALGPLVHHFGWSWNDWDRLACGTLVGHLLECGAQVTGGYFADPGYKNVPDLSEVGFPITEVSDDGSAIITKARGTGGLVSEQTVKEQLLYEVHDPAAYITPDLILDVTRVKIKEIGINRVQVEGARGRPLPDKLKAIICGHGGWLGEGEISYAGPNAMARAKLAVDVLKKRTEPYSKDCRLRADIIGIASVFNNDNGERLKECHMPASDVRVRLAAQSKDRDVVDKVIREVMCLYTCGPAGGGGVRQHISPRTNTFTGLIDRKAIKPRITIMGNSDDR